MGEVLQAPPGPPEQLAIETLKQIATLEIPQLQTPEEIQGFFQELKLGRVFCNVVQLLGEINARSAGYKQLSGTNGSERFLAKYFPERQSDDLVVPGSFHVFIYPNVPFNDQRYTTPITIPEESGVPRVVKNFKGDHGRLFLGEPLGPQDAMAEVCHLAELMADSLSKRTV